jgi:peptidoglycan/xylan/chitin deacetylase (PgdA/CDA1 family)
VTGAAADCPYPDALGTSRVMTVDPAAYPRVGLKSFPQSLPLADKEVVLTFDDGPLPGNTTKVLTALARECARATFFVVGQNAQAYPGLIRRIVAEGHTVGHHSWSHPNLSTISFDDALKNIERGIAADNAALAGGVGKAAPFFRFPYFASTPRLLEALQARRLAVFGADFWASDWENITPERQLKLVTERLVKARKGIVLFHDVQARTAAMLPAFLRYLRVNGYRLVHIVPADARPPRSTAGLPPSQGRHD